MMLGFLAFLSVPIAVEAAGFLQGVGSTSATANPTTASSPVTASAAAQLQTNAQNTLTRTTQALQAVEALQSAARAAALAGANNLGANPNHPGTQLPNVPDGLTDNISAGGAGGLIPDSGLSAAGVANPVSTWLNASTPTQTTANGQTTVTVKQTDQQALLNWKTFNVGKNTTVAFDQTGGGANSSQWIAFNTVSDSTGNPTQILGSINAVGQVYIINQNGVIFGGSSQVNARNLTVSSLPINTNLVSGGLLNNPDAQFLFSGLSVPGGAGGTPNFNPGLPPTGGHYGNVTVQKGAVLTSPAGSAGDGGRVMLVGPNVTNDGTITTEAGQTILAAGLQVGVAAHDSTDPSLRGLDIWIGAVGDYAGTATNTGLIQSHTGSTWMAGRTVNQLGVIDSSTSVSLNGRIDLKASYGAVANPNYLSTTETGGGGPEFFNQYTGVVTLGADSVSRIIPDYASAATVPGATLPERSQVNVEGLAILFDTNSILFAPNGTVSVRAGDWPYKDADGNRTIFGPDGTTVEDGLTNNFNGTTQKFFFDGGQIYVDNSATISVAGSTDVFVPLSNSILNVKLLGPELANSPLQRDSTLRGATLTVDIRNTGTYNGQYWVGTPLGDVTGLANLIQSNAAQLTAAGGNISLQAGGSIVVRNGATLDVSGGYYNHEGGTVNTSVLVTSDGRLVDIKNATPDQIYTGVYTGNVMSPGIFEAPYIEGAAGGSLSLTAPGMALDGVLLGATVQGPRQRSAPPVPGSLLIDFEAEAAVSAAGTTAISYIKNSPTPPSIQFATSYDGGTVPDFALVNNAPVPLPAARTWTVILPSKLLDENGFGSLNVANPDGAITIPGNVTLATAAGGSITLSAANLSVLGSVVAPGGNLGFTTYNISPSYAAAYNILNAPGAIAYPLPSAARGMFVLGSGALLSATGLITDDSQGSLTAVDAPIMSAGGSVSINSYNASLATNSMINVSGGVYVSAKGSITYGKGGNISINTGTDPGFAGVIGGTLSLKAALLGYSGITGGSLGIQASLIDVGGVGSPSALVLPEDFFSQGGFTQYSLTGIGAASAAIPPVGQFESYIPAISIAAGTQIRPVAENYLAKYDPNQGGAITLTPILNADGLRSPVSLSFKALGSDDPFTLNSLEVRGDILMDSGASIVTDPGANVSFNGGTVTLLGTVMAPGGAITVAGAGAFPFTATQRLQVTQALPTVHLGDAAVLSVAGTVQLKPDPYGRRLGKVFNGGTITITGNILAEKGSLLDASGTSGTLDLSPTALSNNSGPGGYVDSGLTDYPLNVQSIATQVDSNGGAINLSGSQMLLSDATLRGGSGGPTATGGQLSVSSGRYYPENAGRTGADINLVVIQSGDVILNPSAPMGVGIGLFDGTHTAYGDYGTFALDRFSEGSFASLSLGGQYFANASPIPYGGNVQFKGKIDLQMSGQLRLAAGGVISADDTVSITASYISAGQNFSAPLNPYDTYLPFQQNPAAPTNAYNFAPAFGPGSLALNAGLIDVGTLSLQNIGLANMTANGGDIRGNGTLGIAGNLTLNAAQVYPTSLALFSIFAYDHTGGTGSVTINSSVRGAVPLSAGGSLAIYASSIQQGGVLRAPLGSISLGWDGTYGNEPVNPVAGATIAPPVTTQITLVGGSLTSVSAATGTGSPELIVPFGISPDGQSWIDPRGVNVTLSGLPQKSVSISGNSVTMSSGAVVDITGGGDLLASRWVPGNGGGMDLLGSPAGAWNGATAYQAGDLVSFGGQTWSAHVANSGKTPSIGLYWSQVATSFAVLPASSLAFAPYNVFNTGANAGALSGDPGYVSPGLSVGETVTLDGNAGLPAGTYTLLPSSYALLPGAFLVTPLSGSGIGTVNTADGAWQVSGYLGNSFNNSVSAPAMLSRFEIAPATVVSNRVAYDTYSANVFLGAAAQGSANTNPQQIPQDAGYAAFHGYSALGLAGQLLTQAQGLGATVDVSSHANIVLEGGSATTDSGPVVLQTSVLTSWDADSLLIGGVRTLNADGSVSLDVRSGNVTLDNPGGNLAASDVVLAAKASITVTGGSSVTATGTSTVAPNAMSVAGDGTLLRVSDGSSASITRAGVAGSAAPLMTIGAGAKLGGKSLILDSTYGTNLASDVKLNADRLVLGSGQISVVFGNASGVLSGSVVSPHLALEGTTLAGVLQSADLTLRSYRSIDFYGSGVLGGTGLKQLTLVGSGIRGYEQTGGSVVINAPEVTFGNSINATTLSSPTGTSGTLEVSAGTISLGATGANGFTVSGYQDLKFNATGSIIVQGLGSFSTIGNLQVTTPLVTGTSGASFSITSGQAMVLDRGTSAGTAPQTTSLGASLTVQAVAITVNNDIILPSGQLTIQASGGDVTIGGNISVAGSSTAFNDITQYTDAGSITLNSLTGNVVLAGGGSVSVSAANGGGNAGAVNVMAPLGSFSDAASLLGRSSQGFTSGGFMLDTGSLAASGNGSLATIDAGLDAGGFFSSRDFRVRSGDVTINHTIHSHEYSLSADQGYILLTGMIDASGHGNILVNGITDASGTTGGSISLSAHGNLTLAPGSMLDVSADKFDDAGKGGSMLLEAGTERNGTANLNALLNLQQGATLDLSVDAYVPGGYNQPGSSAFNGQFTGTLHLRAPRTSSNSDLLIAPIQSTIIGASSIIAEGFKVYVPSGGVLNIALRNQINNDNLAFLGAAGVSTVNNVAMTTKLLSGAADLPGLAAALVIEPGVEIVNPTGDLTLGLANNSSSGTTNQEALAAADWDLSGFRYGSRGAPGILTLRAAGNLVFNNTLSDGFKPTTALNGGSYMWLATLMPISNSLPTNTQDWSFRLTAGADTNAANFISVLPTGALAPSGGSVLIGEFYPAVPNSGSTAIGDAGTTANSLAISTNKGTRFEVIRTGTGDITISAGRDVQLRNQFATIYTAGVALPTPTTIDSTNDFVAPVLPTTTNNHPKQTGSGSDLGAIQQLTQAAWSMAGGNVTLSAINNIGHYTQVNNVLTVDSSRQMPTDWLYRRGYVDPATGLFANNGGVDASSLLSQNGITDVATSTAWWIDYSNFFEGVGALGGGNVSLSAGKDIVNVDAVTPTNARMPGRKINPDYGVVSGAPQYLNVAPDASQLVELGGGDVNVRAGGNINGGVYYVEKGIGMLSAGGSITTNAARSPSLGILNGSAPLDPLTWLPTTLFVGDSHFNVTARGDILLGPVANPFLLPQGLNNGYWYKTDFSTFSPDAGASVSSYGGSVTFRTQINLPGSISPQSILGNWYGSQNLFTGAGSVSNASYYQPWLRLDELGLSTYSTVFSLEAPNLRITALGGDVNLQGSFTLAPSATGNLELLASGGINGLQVAGPLSSGTNPVQVWTAAVINVSDASPTSVPGIATPLAYQSKAGRNYGNAVLSGNDILHNVSLALQETGSYSGLNGAASVKQALHAPGLLHTNDTNPVLLYATGGDISGLTLFSPKDTRIIAQQDITDIAFYLQNDSPNDISLVSAGRDIIPFDANAPLRTLANNFAAGNVVGDAQRATVAGDSTSAMAGDLQISGSGVFEVLSGRNLDLGNGANFTDGTGVGITSIGNSRNPFLPFNGANIIALAGVTSPNGLGPALGMADSSMNIAAFISQYLPQPDSFSSTYWTAVAAGVDFANLSAEQQSIVALEKFFAVLNAAGSEGIKTGKFTAGYDAVKTLFGTGKPAGEILTRARSIRTTSGGAISLAAPGGGITMASTIFGNSLTPPGIVTEYGGAISTFTDGSVAIGQARIFTLRGGDITMWSSNGNIAAGTSARTVVTAPPTRVLVDITSADVQTDLGGLATGGGIGVLASVEGVIPGNVGLYAPTGYVDAGDAGIRVTGNLNIAAQTVINAGNISAAGTSSGSTPAAASAPSVTTVTSASNASAAAGTTLAKPETGPQVGDPKAVEEALSYITVEVLGYGGGDDEDEEKKDKKS